MTNDKKEAGWKDYVAFVLSLILFFLALIYVHWVVALILLFAGYKFFGSKDTGYATFKTARGMSWSEDLSVAGFLGESVFFLQIIVVVGVIIYELFLK